MTIIDYCPVCGIGLRMGDRQEHSCNSKVLGAIDAANTRAINKEFDTNPDKDPFWRTEAQRLNEGLKQLQQDNE